MRHASIISKCDGTVTEMKVTFTYTDKFVLINQPFVSFKGEIWYKKAGF